MLGKFFSNPDSENLVRELQNKTVVLESKLANFEKIFSQIATDLKEQRRSNKQLVSELQNKIGQLEKNLLPVAEENLQTKVVSERFSNDKLFVIHNGIETKMNCEKIFDFVEFTDLKVVTYQISEDFFMRIAKNFNRVSLIIGDKNCSVAKILKDQRMESYITNGELFHDKIFLLADEKNKKYRVVTGSANFTYSAFNLKNFESVRVDDFKKLYDLYLQRFEFLKRQSKKILALDDISFGMTDEQKPVSKITERNVGNYLFENFKTDVKNRKKFAERKTGFKFLDYKQTIYPGLYVLGGTPAVGKTTFVWQLLNQFAMNGETCIYCSYETTTIELTVKAMAQANFDFYDKKGGYGFLTADFIKENPEDKNVQNAVYGFKNKNLALQVFELSEETVEDLLERLQKICVDLKAQKKNPPIVAIDYLQIIPSDKDGAKSAADDTVRKLKIFQRETDSTFFVISSFNRENYQQIGFKSFKESGGIEYTADVVWGLSKLKSTTEEVYDTNLKKNKKIEVREIKMKCIKNRQGKIYDSYFKYYPENDYFKSVKEFPKEEQKSSDDEVELKRVTTK